MLLSDACFVDDVLYLVFTPCYLASVTQPKKCGARSSVKHCAYACPRKHVSGCCSFMLNLII